MILRMIAIPRENTAVVDSGGQVTVASKPSKRVQHQGLELIAGVDSGKIWNAKSRTNRRLPVFQFIGPMRPISPILQPNKHCASETIGPNSEDEE